MNFQETAPPPRSRLRAPGKPLLLRQHPKWQEFVWKLGHMILNQCPDLRPRFLEVLDEADKL